MDRKRLLVLVAFLTALRGRASARTRKLLPVAACIALLVAVAGVSIRLHRVGIRRAPASSADGVTSERNSAPRDGQFVERILFSSDRARTPGTLQQHIWMIKPEGTGLKQLTFGDVNDTQPAVSPDGTQFAFNREQFPRDVEARSIWVKDLTTGKETPITSDTDYPYGPYTSANPTWSPDGSRIAFERSIAEDRDGPGKFTRIWILDVVPAVGSPVRLTPESGVGLLRPSWSPDGRSLLYMRSLWPDGPYAVYRLDLPSRSEEQVISTGNDYVPRWSPDGSRMLWTSYKLSERGDVFITDLARPSDSQFRLTPYSGWAEAAWSPDGSKLVLVSSSIKLSDNSLASLQSIGFREEMLSKLSVLKGREFVRAEDFLAALTATIGEAAAIRYADKIAQHSDPNERLWITNADGSNFVQLTPMPLLLNGLCWARIFQSKKAQ